MAQQSDELRLPHQLSEWHEARKKFKCEDMSIHNLVVSNSTYPEISIQQVLTLKVLYLVHPISQIEKYVSDLGFAPNLLNEKMKTMKSRKAWKLYIDALKDNVQAAKDYQTLPWTQLSKFSDEMGGFAIVLKDQLEILDLPTENPDSEVVKVTITPTPEQTEETSTSPPPQYQQDDTFHKVVVLPPGEIDTFKFPDNGDERLIMFNLSHFLNALGHDSNEKHKLYWSMRKKEFQFQSSQVRLEARPDGHLVVKSRDHAAAIFVVKARSRRCKGDGEGESDYDDRIQMQECMQMVLWINSEPEAHWLKPKASPTTSETDTGEEARRMFYRILISQNHGEIFLTIAEYTQRYIDYLHKRDGVSINDDDVVLRMNMFGAFDISQPHDMEVLGAVVKLVCGHAVDVS